MGGLFGNTTKQDSALSQNGVVTPVGQDQALAAANKYLPAIAAATTPTLQSTPVSVTANPASPVAAPSGFVQSGDGPAAPIMTGGPQLMFQSKPLNAPTIVTPTFKQTVGEQGGEASNYLSPSLTTKGKILAGLLTATQGASDAIKGGALNARPGQSGFGTGFAAAEEAPRVRMLEDMQAQRLRNQNAIEDNNLKNAPLLFQQDYNLKQSEIDKNKQLGNYYDAGSQKRGQDQFKFIPGVGLKNLSSGEITDKVPPQNVDPKTETQLRLAAAQGDKDAQTAVDGLDNARKGLKATAPGKATSTSNLGPATTTAAKLLQRNGNDVNATLADFNTQLANSQNADLQRDAPLIIRAIKAGGTKGAKKSPAPSFNNQQAAAH